MGPGEKIVRFGVHVSIGKGFKGAIDQAVSLGCDGFQIFAGNPRGWARKPIDRTEVDLFKKTRQNIVTGAGALWPVVVHLSYLPNIASDNADLFEKSITAFSEDFRRANLLEADFFVFHPGKSKDHSGGIDRIISTVNMILEDVAGPTILLFENQAGGGGELAGEFKDLGLIFRGLKQSDRVGMCFDTCHAFAAGYDLSNQSGWERTLEEFDRQIGLSFLKLFHLNDAAGNLGSHLDRHQHIGEGTIGLPGFDFLVNHPVLNKIPGILETPQDSPGDDIKNLNTIRNLQKK
jgi:deoxyribonuclease-4